MRNVIVLPKNLNSATLESVYQTAAAISADGFEIDGRSLQSGSAKGERAGASPDQIAIEELLFPGPFRKGTDSFGYGGLRRIAAVHNGLMSMRSGRVCIRVVPPWMDLPAVVPDLAYFPGIQIGMTLWPD